MAPIGNIYIGSALEGVVKTLIQITIMTSQIWFNFIGEPKIWLKFPNALSIFKSLGGWGQDYAQGRCCQNGNSNHYNYTIATCSTCMESCEFSFMSLCISSVHFLILFELM